MTKQLLIAVTAAALAPAALLAQQFQQEGWMRHATPSSSVGGQTGPVVGRPLSATEVRHTQQVLSDGSRITQSETTKFYRDGQGRMRIESSTGAMIYDPVEGFICDVTFRTKTCVKTAISASATTTINAAAGYSGSDSRSGTSRQTPSGGPVKEDLAPQTVNGLFSRGSRVTATIPAGAIGNDRDLKVVNERWVSDDLQVLVKSTNTDPRFGTSTYELTNIVQAAPDAALFKIPDGYTVTSGYERH
jgi:uncharacterized protein YdeI (BOF family)